MKNDINLTLIIFFLNKIGHFLTGTVQIMKY